MSITLSDVVLTGDLVLPAHLSAIVVFAHGSGSSRRSPRNIAVAHALNERRIATLLFDLLTAEEDMEEDARFDIELLADRLEETVRWVTSQVYGTLPLGLFGASTGAAAALIAAAALGTRVGAVVSRGGRPDLASRRLHEVSAPTLFIVGGADPEVLELNKQALAALRCQKKLAVIPGATHLFEESGALGQVAHLAGEWFSNYLAAPAKTGRTET